MKHCGHLLTLKKHALTLKTTLHSEGPSLPVIHSAAEQKFLSNYLFKTEKKVDNFWLGAKYSATSQKISWIDNSEMTYTNWDRSPRNRTNYCAQMQADDASTGKWLDEPCEKKNLVVCQRRQTSTMSSLERTLRQARQEFRDGLEVAKKEIDSLKQSLAASKGECAKETLLLRKTLEDEIVRKDRELKQSLLPPGFIYVQLSMDKSPAELWPWANWTEISSSYAGVFFRVVGGGAGSFGSIQEANSNTVSHVKSHSDYSFTKQVDVKLTPGHWSEGIYTGASAGTFPASEHLLTFYTTDGEVRPRNMAMRVWKRVA